MQAPGEARRPGRVALLPAVLTQPRWADRRRGRPVPSCLTWNLKCDKAVWGGPVEGFSIFIDVYIFKK